MSKVTKVLETERTCDELYPWRGSDENRPSKTIFSDNYLDYLNYKKTKSKPSQNTLTTMACGIPHTVNTDLIEELCERGVSMVVFDFYGLSAKQCTTMIDEIRNGVFKYSLHKNNKKPYSMTQVLDLGGSRILTGSVLNAKNPQNLIELSTNNHIYLTNDKEYKNMCNEDCIYVSSDSILRLKKNDRIYLDYKIELIVERVDDDQVYCVIKIGDYLGSRKTVHIPGIPIGVTTLTKEDEKHIQIGIQHKIDAIMVPGVRNAAFFNCVKEFVNKNKDNTIDMYARIDNSEGLENVDEIISAADGLFLHRLNLSMEIGYAKIILAQKMMLSKCNKAGKPVLTHGGFLNSLEFSAVPQSAEINDVVSTVMDGTDGIYLDVTKRSQHVAHCVQYLSYLCRQGEAAVWEQNLFPEINYKLKPKVDPVHAMCIGCAAMSLKTRVAAIIVITTTGKSAKAIARYRPKCPVLVVIRHAKTARKLSVWRNLLVLYCPDPIVTDWSRDVKNRTEYAIAFAKEKAILNQGDMVIHMSCSKPTGGFADTMGVFYVRAADTIEA